MELVCSASTGLPALASAPVAISKKLHLVLLATLLRHWHIHACGCPQLMQHARQRVQCACYAAGGSLFPRGIRAACIVPKLLFRKRSAASRNQQTVAVGQSDVCCCACCHSGTF